MDVKMPDGDRKLPPVKMDPLRRIFIPIERSTKAGTVVFRTSDKEMYVRLEDGSIHRTVPKLSKAARKQVRRNRTRNRKGA